MLSPTSSSILPTVRAAARALAAVAAVGLSLSCSSSSTGTAGSTLSYTVTLVNLGPSTAANVTLTDVLGAGLS